MPSFVPRFYVATAYPNKMVAQRFIDDLLAAGYIVTHDWTRTEQAAKPTGEDRRLYGDADFDGASQCDTLVLLGDADFLYGALIEVGIALASGVEVLVAGPVRRDSVFFYLSPDRADVKMFENENAVRYHLGLPEL
jgi:hypothetical protein